MMRKFDTRLGDDGLPRDIGTGFEVKRLPLANCSGGGVYEWNAQKTSIYQPCEKCKRSHQSSPRRMVKKKFEIYLHALCIACESEATRQRKDPRGNAGG